MKRWSKLVFALVALGFMVETADAGQRRRDRRNQRRGITNVENQAQFMDGSVIIRESAIATIAEPNYRTGLVDTATTGPTTSFYPATPTGARTNLNIVEVILQRGTFNTLVRALETANLIDTLRQRGSFTLFAPTDEAFRRLPTGTLDNLMRNPEQLRSFLLFHVARAQVTANELASAPNNRRVAGVQTMQGLQLPVRFDGSRVYLGDNVRLTATDILAANGVIQVIDTVLDPDQFGEENVLAKPNKNIPEVAADYGSFSRLVTALKTTNLFETLEGSGQFTLFAPTDEAFQKLPEGTLEALLKDKQKLSSILKFHLIEGKVPARKVMTMDGKTVSTVNGRSFTVRTEGNTVTLVGPKGEARVIRRDMKAKNGIIHVVDTVLIPD